MPQLKAIPLDRLQDPDQVLRSYIPDDGIEELARSMQAVGLRQPIRVRQHGDTYQLQEGHRRVLAARWLQWTHILALISDAHEATGLIPALIENVQRQDLAPTDEAAAINQLHHQSALSVKEIAQRLGKTDQWVRSRLAIAALPEDLRARLAAGEVTIGVALALGEIADPAWRDYYTAGALREGATIAKVSQWAAQAQEDAQRQRAEGQPISAPSMWAAPPEPLYPCFGCRVPQPITRLQNQFICGDCLDAVAVAAEVTH